MAAAPSGSADGSAGAEAAGHVFAGAGQQEEGGLECWRIEQMQPVPVDPKHYGHFYDGDSYICLKTHKDWKNGPKWELYFWLGQDSSTDEQGAAAIMSVELDEMLGGGAVQHREMQGHESAGFLSVFGGNIEYLSGGVKSGFNHVEPEVYPTRLLHVKGRKQCRVSTVELACSSLNAGDVFILDMGERLYQWNGSGANQQERSKALEVCNGIRTERVHNDAIGPVQIAVLGQDAAENEAEDEATFWEALGGKGEVAPAVEDSDTADAAIAAGTALWRLTEIEKEGKQKLQATEVKKRPLVRDMLDPDDVFILAGPSELFIWIGNGASKGERQRCMLFAQSFLAGKKRPAWTPITRVVQGSEPTLFTSQFVEWDPPEAPPDLHRHLSTSSNIAKRQAQASPAELALTMVATAESMEKAAAARAKAAAKEMPDTGGAEGQVDVWIISKFKHVPVPREMHGLFHAGDCYIVSFAWEVNNKKNVILYYWLGRMCSTDEKGSAALLTKQMDDEMGGLAVQVRVVQNNEPEHFLSLFKGRMVVRDGGQSKSAVDTRDKDGVALFQIKGSDPMAIRAVQVPEVAASLNSGDCFVLQRPGTVHVWQGRHCSPEEHATSELVGTAVAERLTSAAQSSGDDAADALTGGEAPAEEDESMKGPPVSMRLGPRPGGKMPKELHKEKLGVFVPSDQVTNERPSYSLESNPNLMLWWGNGRWWVGKRAELGLNRGWIKAESAAMRPSAAGLKWLVYDKEGKTWVEAADCTCAPAARIRLGGEAPSGAHADKLGEYVLCAAASNERPCYFREARPNLMLWWGGGRWWLGKRDELGTNRGWIKCASDAASPVGLSAWVVHSKEQKAWLAAEAMVCSHIEPPALSKRPKAPPGPAPTHWAVERCAEGEEPPEFWSTLGGRGEYSQQKAAPPDDEIPPRLFECSNRTGAFKVEEIFDFSQEDMEQDDIYILDSSSTTYVWVGAQASDFEADMARQTAEQYVTNQATAEGRAADAVVVVKAGEEPLTFTANFVGWSKETTATFEDPYERKQRLMREEREQASGAAASAAGADEGVVEEKPPSPSQILAAARKQLGESRFASPPPKPLDFTRPAFQRTPTPPRRPIGVPGLQMEKVARMEAELSARRRANAAKAAAGEAAEEYADPTTHRYNYEEITTNRALPLNPVCRELYLQEPDFFKIFGMEKKAFYAMRMWQQRELKRKHGLF